MFDLLKKLTEISGPSGREEKVQDYIFESLKMFTKEVKITEIGNILAHLGGSGKKVIVNAHADEIAFYVRSIDEDGFIYVLSHGLRGISPPFLVGQRVTFLGDEGDVPGVFAATTGHILKASEMEKKWDIWDTFIDIGASNKKEVEERGIHIGTPVTWRQRTEKMDDLAIGKAMDDRAGLAIILKLAEKLQEASLKYDVYLASTVQEETGFIGAVALSSQERFDICLTLEVGIAGDYPSVEKNRLPLKIRKGPILVHKDSVMCYSQEILQNLKSVSIKHEIPFQHGIFFGYGTDARDLTHMSLKPALIAFPTRYTHTPFETVAIKDLETTVDLLYYYLTF